MKLLVPEIFERASALPTQKERRAFLRENDCPELRDIIRINYDPTIESLLPKGKPPYTADEAPEGKSPSHLGKKFRRFKYFFNGPTGLKTEALKRESMFIELLESIHYTEAELLVAAKDKKMKYPGITEKLCKDAFPGLIAETEE
tara:strand:+ start:852 stop:1286 length:435 start_codon:yes stop_codon:yes gene_type:complete